MSSFDPAFARNAARIALTNVTREYPSQPSHVFASAADAVTPRVLHPAFYGSYDWHSSVHMHWLLARVLRLHPALDEAGDIIALLDRHLTRENIAAECAYFARPHTGSFERSYGWAWVLALAQELAALGEIGARWGAAIAPLATLIVARFEEYLPRAQRPIRHGMHANSAFGLIFALAFARVTRRAAFEALIVDRATRWFGSDREAPARWEPSGADFLSPSLVEAELMRRVLAPGVYATWFDLFLPQFADAAPVTLFTPVGVSDRGDWQIAHLDGLNLSRAWCFGGIARAFRGDARGHMASIAFERHLDAGLAGMASAEYAGTHWLASFAALALSTTAAE
ncbi:MAG TPA: DUF2891 domain-containing protein [Casimicrobiaceae bacterium]